MNNLHRNNVKLATWIGRVTPAPEQTAHLEHSMDFARSWLRHGEKRMQVWRIQRLAPTQYHPLQAG